MIVFGEGESAGDRAAIEHDVNITQDVAEPSGDGECGRGPATGPGSTDDNLECYLGVYSPSASGH